MSERVSISIRDGIADVKFNRPEKMNALDDAMFRGIIDAGVQLKDLDVAEMLLDLSAIMRENDLAFPEILGLLDGVRDTGVIPPLFDGSFDVSLAAASVVSNKIIAHGGMTEKSHLNDFFFVITGWNSLRVASLVQSPSNFVMRLPYP